MKALRVIIPWLVILSLPAVMLYPLWWHPTSAGEDDVMWFYPTRKLVGQALRQGRWPLTSASEAAGAPLIADPQAAVLYPVTWLFAITQAKTAYSLSIFAAFSLAGLGMYLYLQRLGVFRPAALFGAVAFMFSGFMVGHRVHLSLIHTAAFFPWVLWCIEDLPQRPFRAFAFLTPIVALAIASGHWPTLVHMALVSGVYLLLRARPLGRSIAVAAAASALAALITAPQIIATADLMARATRQHIGYATAGENSFFPAAAVLALFPMLMGSRTPNFFPQHWWGPWHLCEMLGYVGLITLALAGTAVWRMYRKDNLGGPLDARHNRAVRIWTWIAAGAGVWMLGYYLPSYRLIYMLPVLGMVRCPARMLLAVDLALATLAAVALNAIARSNQATRLLRTVRRSATIVLPAAMLAVLALLAGVAWALTMSVPQKPGAFHFFAGWAQEALRAVHPANPAVWVPVALVLITAATVLFWLHRPRRRMPALVLLLLVDLFFITRFVDIPPTGVPKQDPENSPAAKWLNDRPGPGAYRIWGLGRHYCDRPAELLLPRTANGLGFATLASYDPLHNPAHAHLFGFNALGLTHQWAWLIRNNRLLSLYNVRYILAADSKFRKVIESVAIPAKAPEPDGPDLLGDNWELQNVTLARGVLSLRTPVMWRWALAMQPVSLESGATYRISVDARAERGAANFLRAEFFQKLDDAQYFTEEQLGMTVIPEQIGPDWRHFEYTFQSPADLSGQVLFRIFTMSERRIDVRNISLCRSRPDVPMGFQGRLKRGQRVYRKIAELRPLNPTDPPVAIYENLLCGPAPPASNKSVTPQFVEKFKWSDPRVSSDTAVPDLTMRLGLHPTYALVMTTLPGSALYAVLIAGAHVFRRSKRTHGTRRTLQRLYS